MFSNFKKLVVAALFTVFFAGQVVAQCACQRPQQPAKQAEQQ